MDLLRATDLSRSILHDAALPARDSIAVRFAGHVSSDERIPSRGLGRREWFVIVDRMGASARARAARPQVIDSRCAGGEHAANVNHGGDMRRLVAGLSLTSLLLVAGACERSADQADGGRESTATAESTTVAPDSQAGESAVAEHAGAGHAAAGDGGQALLPIMQKLGGDMTTLTHALMTDDYPGVERSAAAIAEHAPISAEELARIHTLLGPETTRFEAVDESVHVASVRLHEAARARRPGQVVERLGEVQRGCVSCHVQFRERLLTNRGGQ